MPQFRIGEGGWRHRARHGDPRARCLRRGLSAARLCARRKQRACLSATASARPMSFRMPRPRRRAGRLRGSRRRHPCVPSCRRSTNRCPASNMARHRRNTGSRPTAARYRSLRPVSVLSRKLRTVTIIVVLMARGRARRHALPLRASRGGARLTISRRSRMSAAMPSARPKATYGGSRPRTVLPAATPARTAAADAARARSVAWGVYRIDPAGDGEPDRDTRMPDRLGTRPLDRGRCATGIAKVVRSTGGRDQADFRLFLPRHERQSARAHFGTRLRQCARHRSLHSCRWPARHREGRLARAAGRARLPARRTSRRLRTVHDGAGAGVQRLALRSFPRRSDAARRRPPRLQSAAPCRAKRWRRGRARVMPPSAAAIRQSPARSHCAACRRRPSGCVAPPMTRTPTTAASCRTRSRAKTARIERTFAPRLRLHF